MAQRDSARGADDGSRTSSRCHCTDSSYMSITSVEFAGITGAGSARGRGVAPHGRARGCSGLLTPAIALGWLSFG